MFTTPHISQTWKEIHRTKTTYRYNVPKTSFHSYSLHLNGSSIPVSWLELWNDFSQVFQNDLSLISFRNLQGSQNETWIFPAFSIPVSWGEVENDLSCRKHLNSFTNFPKRAFGMRTWQRFVCSQTFEIIPKVPKTSFRYDNLFPTSQNKLSLLFTSHLRCNEWNLAKKTIY